MFENVVETLHELILADYQSNKLCYSVHNNICSPVMFTKNETFVH